MILFVVLDWNIVLDDHWDDKSHDIGEYITSCLIDQLGLADVENLGATDIVFLKHVIHDVENLFS